MSAVSASPSGHELDRLLADLINTANTTLYDKAIDARYLVTHGGGARLHHLTDGCHDLAGAFAAARATAPEGSTAEAVLGTAQHLAKDLFSVMGLPVVSVDPDAYRRASDWTQKHLGIPKAWQADFLQLNAMDVLGGGLTVAAVVLGVNHADSAALAEIAAGAGLAGALGANPLALLAGAVALVASWRLRTSGTSWSPELQRASVAVASTGAAFGTGMLTAGFAASGGLPLLASLVMSLAAGLLVRGMLLRRSATEDGAARSGAVGPSRLGAEEEVWLGRLKEVLRTAEAGMDEEVLSILRRSLAGVG